MNYELYDYDGRHSQFGMGAFNWGSFLGGIGSAINTALNQNPWGQQYPGGGQYPAGNNAALAAACTNSGGYWNPVTNYCTPRNTSGNDVSFSGSTFFWVLAGVVAFSLLSKRR